MDPMGYAQSVDFGVSYIFNKANLGGASSGADAFP
jgi:hypothetical protein